ncbi:hypothetical protein LguiB_020107 [Lonicera macranthoides]
MESLSRSLQRNHHHHASPRNFSQKQLSNANSFSSKNAYDDVFAGPPKFGASTFSSRVEDYKEIFGGGSRASSIPVLDLSDLDDETNNVSADFRSSAPDYSSIFVGFQNDEDIGMSYDQLFAKTKTASTTKSPYQHSDRLNSGERNQSFDAVKQFNMSYHKTTQKIKDETKVTTHVAELDAVPGFTCFIDESAPPKKTEGGKQKPSAVNDVRQKMDASVTSPLAKKQTSGGAVRSRSGSSWDGTYESDKLFNAHEIHLKSQPSKVSPPLKRSMASNKGIPRTDARECSPDSSDEELDVNSAAAASVAALRKAIQKAQESIRIAKELMEKKEVPQNYSKKGSKKVKNRQEKSTAPQGNRTKEQNIKETCERARTVSQSFTDVERKNELRSEEVAPDFKEGDISFRAQVHPKNLDAAEKCEAAEIGLPELVNTGEHRRAMLAFEQADRNNDIIVQSMGKYEQEFQEIATVEALEQQEDFTEKAEVIEKAYEKEDMERKGSAFEENLDSSESTHVVDEQEENEKPGIAQEVEETEDKQNGIHGQECCEEKMDELLETAEDEFFESRDWNEKDNEMGLNGSLELVQNANKQEVPEQEIIEKRMKDDEFEENENIVGEIQDEEVLAKRLQEAFQWVENEIRLREVFDGSSSEPKQEDEHAGDVIETGLHEEKETADNIEIERDVSEENERTVFDEKRPTDTHDCKETEENTSVCMGEGDEKTVAGANRYEAAGNVEREANEIEENEEKEVEEKRPTDTDDGKESEKNMKEWEREGDEKSIENIQTETDGSEENEEIEVPKKALYDDHFNGVSDASNSMSETEDSCQHEINDNNVEMCPKVSDNDGSTLGVSKAFCEFEVDDNEVVEAAFRLNKIEIEGDAEGDEKDGRDDGNLENFGSIDLDVGENQVEHNTEDSESASSDIENGIDILVSEFRENDEIIKEGEIAFGVEEKRTPKTARRKRWFAENTKEMETSEVPKKAHRKRWFAENAKEMEAYEVRISSKENEKTIEIDEEIKAREATEKKNEESLNKSFAIEEEKDYKETASKEDLREFDEANKREREREKDRIVVERAIREARERAFAEARERAERAAVERANAEVRQRVMAEAREKASSAGTTNKSFSSEKASQEAKLKAERAAVERATSEARKRALEKAKFSHNTSEARPQPERFVNEKFSGASGDLSSSDSLRFEGTNTESFQRSRLEKHQRIMQRAAKALAEKNMRDLLVQKEQAEKNRLSESLNADIKRWSSGKEGNLRALLSTLQYILGPGSGWQPVSLTDIVTNTAVKKAYRKATLYVHPDKLQQRGASIQQKYICEKVFDLLKAAWNKFNSEER